MARRSDMRASDADREQIAERLRHATAEGRLFAHELEERLARALRARTYGELDAVVADLPRQRVARRERSDFERIVKPALTLAVAIPLAAVAVALVIAAMLFLLTGVFAVWMIWMAIGWWTFGRGRGQRRHDHGHRHGHGHHSGPGPQPPSRFGPPRRPHARPWL